MRERMHASVNTEKTGNHIVVHLQHSLDTNIYNIALTLKTYVPKEWERVEVKQGNYQELFKTQKDPKGNYIVYRASANKGAIKLSARTL